jgi:hypothetical protein
VKLALCRARLFLEKRYHDEVHPPKGRTVARRIHLHAREGPWTIDASAGLPDRLRRLLGVDQSIVRP